MSNVAKMSAFHGFEHSKTHSQDVSETGSGCDGTNGRCGAVFVLHALQKTRQHCWIDVVGALGEVSVDGEVRGFWISGHPRSHGFFGFCFPGFAHFPPWPFRWQLQQGILGM